MRAATVVLAAFISAGFAAPAAPADQACLAQVIGPAPPPVAAFIRRHQTCLIWRGDEPIGPKQAHAAATPKRIRALNCDLLNKDEAELRRRFAGDHAAIRALDRDGETLC